MPGCRISWASEAGGAWGGNPMPARAARPLAFAQIDERHALGGTAGPGEGTPASPAWGRGREARRAQALANARSKLASDKRVVQVKHCKSQQMQDPSAST